MVKRNLNKSIGQVMGIPPFWLRQVLNAEWQCRKCKVSQGKGTVTFEIYLKSEKKAYLCLPCAKTLLEDAISRIDVCRNLGADAYAMLDEL